MISVIVPVFNEEKTLKNIFFQILRQRKFFDLEIVAIDDASTDNSLNILKDFAKEYLNITVLSNQKNSGKGFCLKRGVNVAKGEIIIFQDADSEYSPNDYSKLLYPLLNNLADVVYGSRFLKFQGEKNRFFYANKFLTKLSNLTTGLNLSDMETCFKVFRADLIKNFKFKEKRFGIEPEITAFIAKKIKKENLKLIEIPISYNPRNYNEGKKIGLKDGLRAIFVIVKYLF